VIQLRIFVVTADRASSILTHDYLSKVNSVHSDLLSRIDDEKSSGGLTCFDCRGSTLLDLVVDDEHGTNNTSVRLFDSVRRGEFNLTWPVFLHPFKFKSYWLPGAVAMPTLSTDGEVMMATNGLVLSYKFAVKTEE
jgi:hypothetical protein